MSLTAEQLKNAQIIYSVGRNMGMSTRDIQIALITAMQESSLRNLDYGDRDSLGLFQQRPSQGWGTPEQVTNPVYAARKFYSSLRALGERRYDMSMTEAAQAVQRSAYPDAYAKHIPLIRAMYPKISGGQPAGATTGGSDNSVPFPQLQDLSAADLGVKVPPPDAPRGAGNDGPGGMTVAGIDPASGVQPNILAAQYSSLLAAPTFDAYGGTIPAMDTPPAWVSPLSPETFQVVKDKAASDGTFVPSKGVDGWRAAVVQGSRRYIGDPYVWGGTQPGGFDCSGFVQYVYQQAGINLPRVSYQQANSGKRIGIGELRPGDLVAWDNSTRNNGADHIAIYIGNGQIIEAPKPGLSVRVRKLGSSEGAWGVRINR